ncbi:YigZ family protein [Moorellaceae bacterium AZ2]
MQVKDTFTTVAGQAEVQLKIERSVFIGCAKEVANEAEAADFIARRQKLHRRATHNCFAYRLGLPPRDITYYSDAGEPSGTAGRPILGAILSLGLTNVAVVVTRYFGGKKLGVRGLIEAYGQTARRVLEEAGRIKKIVMQPVTLSCSYAALERVLYHINSCGGRVVTAEYGPLEVHLQAEVPVSAGELFEQKVAALAVIKEQKYDGQ